MSNKPQNPLFELQETIYQSGNYTRRRLHQTRLSWVANSIDKYAAGAPIDRAIEYGPGSGIYLPILSGNFKSIVAADIENSYLNGILPLVDKIDGLSLVADDILDTKLPKEYFGLILCSEVLEHVINPERAIKTLYQILKPGGIAIVTTPQRYSLLELCCKVAFLPGVIQLVRMIYRESILETGHISLRSSIEFHSSLANAGFEILEEEKFGLYVPLIAEFGGSIGGRFIENLERRFKNTFFNRLFWTQAYVLRRPLN